VEETLAGGIVARIKLSVADGRAAQRVVVRGSAEIHAPMWIVFPGATVGASAGGMERMRVCSRNEPVEREPATKSALTRLERESVRRTPLRGENPRASSRRSRIDRFSSSVVRSSQFGAAARMVRPHSNLSRPPRGVRHVAFVARTPAESAGRCDVPR